MEFNKAIILSKLTHLSDILIKNKEFESDKKSIELYNFHINATENIIQSIYKSSDQKLKNILKTFFESEGRAYGWSFLPNANGREAEEAFWNLKNEFGFSNP